MAAQCNSQSSTGNGACSTGASWRLRVAFEAVEPFGLVGGEAWWVFSAEGLEVVDVVSLHHGVGGPLCELVDGP